MWTDSQSVVVDVKEEEEDDDGEYNLQYNTDVAERKRERKKIDSASAASDTAERIDSSRVTHGSISTGEYIIETSDWEINKKLSTKKKETDEEKKKYSHLIKRKKKCICLNCNRHRLS